MPASAQTTTLPAIDVVDRAGHGPLTQNRPASSATRTGISVHEAPLSLDGVSADQMQERGDTGLAQAVTRTVGLTHSGTPGNGGLSFGCRGLSGVSSVAVAEDGVNSPVASGTIAYPGTTWGYERIEVLRGPGALAYGSGTLGCTLNAVRKTPGRDRAHEVLLGLGTESTARLGVGTTGPLGERASYRMDAWLERSDGERPLDRSRAGQFMGTLRLEPRHDLTIDLMADHGDRKPTRYWGTPGIDGQVVRDLRDHNYNVGDSIIRHKDDRLRARVEWRASEQLSVSNELHHFRADRHWRNIEAYAFDPAAGTVTRTDYLEIGHDQHQTGNRLSVRLDLAEHQLAAGWDVSRASFTGSNNSPYGGESVVSAFRPEPGSWNSPDPFRPSFDTELTQHAFYLEDAWRLAPRWLLLAGLRSDHHDFSRTDRLDGEQSDKKLRGTSTRVGLSHQLSAGTQVYGQYSSGHDPVGTLLTLNTASNLRLSRGRQIEVGIKQQLPAARLSWTLALFDLRKKDILTQDPDRPSMRIQGGSQSARGIELSGSFDASRQLRLEGNLNLLDAKFDSLRERGNDRSGNRPSGTARTGANLWAHYQHGNWQASAGLRHVGKRFADNANTTTMPAYTLMDASLAWQLDRRTTLALTLHNLADKLYLANSYGSSQFILGDGRRAVLSAHIRF